MRDFTQTIAAGASFTQNNSGKVFTLKAATLPVNVAFDGGTERSLKAGAVINLTATGGFKLVTLINKNSVAVTVTFYIAEVAAAFSANDNAASNAQTYLYGNCGIANSANANLPNSDGSNGGVTNIACDASGYLSIPNTPNIKIVGTNTGHRRQVIIFSIAPTTVSANGLNVLDPNGITVLTIPAGSPPVAFPTDSDVFVSGAGGTAKVTIGQVFLSA
jgi:hypothetical protein